MEAASVQHTLSLHSVDLYLIVAVCCKLTVHLTPVCIALPPAVVEVQKARCKVTQRMTPLGPGDVARCPRAHVQAQRTVTPMR